MCILALSVDGKEIHNLIDNFPARHVKQYLYYLSISVVDTQILSISNVFSNCLGTGTMLANFLMCGIMLVCLGVAAILFLTVYSVGGGALLDKPFMVFLRM